MPNSKNLEVINQINSTYRVFECPVHLLRASSCRSVASLADQFRSSFLDTNIIDKANVLCEKSICFSIKVFKLLLVSNRH